MNDNVNFDWAEGFLTRWLDSNRRISTAAIKARCWMSLPITDIMNVLEAEWLANAIQRHSSGSPVGIAFEYCGRPEIQVLAATRDELLYFNGTNSWRNVIITSLNESFIYFKDGTNRFHLLCGSKKFVYDSCKSSLDTSRIMYFEEWVNCDHHNEQEKRFMTDIWNEYFICKESG